MRAETFGAHGCRMLARFAFVVLTDRRPLFQFWVFAFAARPLDSWSVKRTAPIVPTFDELLAELLEQPEGVLGILSDIVTRGRLQADDLPADALGILADFDLVAFLIQRARRQPLRTWVYPTPLGLRVFATLEREAERLEPSQAAGGRGHGVSR